ncbi:serine hydrolase [Streptomyces sp. NPDC001389]|uniref:D-alanyl-D-alanine carboxypeptidase n=1 Tax=Streptomyces sp. NPDC001389 TaxID=3364569 RepID=UPI0036BFECDC
MKAESVADGGGTGDTLALTGRERAAALAGRGRSDTDGREPAGAEAGSHTASGGERAAGGDRKATTSTAGPAEDTAAARESQDDPDPDTTSGKDRTTRDEPGSVRTDAHDGNGAVTEGSRSPRADMSAPGTAPEAAATGPVETRPRTEEPRPGVADGDGDGNEDAAKGSQAAGADTAGAGTPAEPEQDDADDSEEADTAAEADTLDGEAPDTPEPADAEAAAGAPSPAPGDSARSGTPGRNAAGGRASAQDRLRHTQDGTTGEGTPGDPGPGAAERRTSAAPEPRAARSGTPGRESPARPVPGAAAAGADSAAEDESSTARPRTRDGENPAEAGQQGTDPGDRVGRAGVPGPQRTGGADAAQPAAPASPAAGPGTAPARRPSWAKRDDRTQADEAPARAAADPRTSAWGRPTDDDAARKRSGGGGSTAATGKGGTEPATADEDAAERRPSWAKGGDEPQKDDGTPAAGQAPDDAGPSGVPTSREEPEDDGTDTGSGDRPTAEVAAPAPEAGADAPKAAGRPGTGAGGRKPAAGAAPARRDPKGGAETTRAAAAPPHDPERTSEFVALKDPDAVGPKPTPTPARTPAPPALEPTRETPRPPLDLLAELTNTAPPPETPRRTLTRRVKVWTPIVLLLGAAVAGGQMLRPLPAPRLVAAQDSLTLDGTTSIPWPAKGQAAVRVPGSGDIGTFGEQKPVPTASVGKVMTAYVILKNHPLRKNDPGPRIEVDAQAAAEGNSENESRIKSLTVGQKFSEQDMLKMMMIPSANNIARLLARWDSGSEAAFVAKMNAAAKELGMRDTAYTDPSGLHSGTVSTAVDQLRLAEAVMQEEAFRAIVATPDTRIEGLPDPIINNNTLLSARGLSNKGIKTGSSTPAGGTLMWAAYKTVDGETPLILGTMMDQHAGGPDPDARDSLALVLENSRKVIEAVRTALATAPAIRKGQTVGYVSDGLGGRTPLVAARDLPVIGVPGQRLRLALGTAGGKPVPHEAKAGTEVGVLTVGDGPGAKTVPVAVGTKLREPSFGTRVTRLS